MEYLHQPVLFKEVIQYLDPQPGQNFIDATVGNGGHSKAILEKIGPSGRLLAIDLDSDSLERTQDNLKPFMRQIVLARDNFSNLKNIVAQNFNHLPVQGILLDLGFSLDQIKTAGRGFSFQEDEFLDMRYAPESQTLSAADIINRKPLVELVQIFSDFGEERYARKIGQAIVDRRKKQPITTTGQLVEVIQQIYPKKLYYRLHPATRVFQALRIAVNHELDNLIQVLPQAVEILSPGGRLAVISFHSLEDRIVKRFFKNESNLDIITKKPIIASQAEIEINPKSRSAKLRVARKN